MERVTAFASKIIEVDWDLWVALGMAGQNWLRAVAIRGQRLPDGGWRLELPEYRLEQFLAVCERGQK
jgi:hypothetical protein